MHSEESGQSRKNEGTLETVNGDPPSPKYAEKRHIDDSEDEEDEVDEFGRVKRRRQRFRCERTEVEEGEYDRNNGEDDHEDDYHRYHSRRRPQYSRRDSSPYHRSSRRRRSSHYRSDSESPDEGYGRRRRQSRHRAYPDTRDPYDAAARYIDTEFFPTKIYIGDLEGISYDELERAFARYGPVRQIKMVENKDYAFVTYDDQESAMGAIKGMHGALLGSRHIKVNRAKIPERNQVGFGNVPWTDNDGDLAKEEMRSYPVSREISPLFGSDNHTPPPVGRALTSYDDL
ncbi:hypothetical protein BJV82DRAFT_589141 [Fennellomyces sp. T-0311]|nr:hypothetical protein BJV82DRAFT_589141 [Fennellomyces sp. T-0311]